MPHTVTEAIEAIARGEIVIVTDDDDRENEGDLVCAASLCTPEMMAFIIRNTCGIVCAPVTAEDVETLVFAASAVVVNVVRSAAGATSNEAITFWPLTNATGV